jgi:hypothetical protein
MDNKMGASGFAQLVFIASWPSKSGTLQETSGVYSSIFVVSRFVSPKKINNFI